MASGHDKTLENPESRLSIHEVPEQISRIFFGKPEVRIFDFVAFENGPIFFKHYEFLCLFFRLKTVNDFDPISLNL